MNIESVPLRDIARLALIHALQPWNCLSILCVSQHFNTSSHSDSTSISLTLDFDYAHCCFRSTVPEVNRITRVPHGKVSDSTVQIRLNRMLTISLFLKLSSIQKSIRSRGTGQRFDFVEVNTFLHIRLLPRRIRSVIWLRLWPPIGRPFITMYATKHIAFPPKSQDMILT